tara:strand:+ start:307 stop:480 length:174 start_codon:yes stop_codon:yes gene_type:complete
MNKYNIIVWTGKNKGNEKLHFTFTQSELNKLKKDVEKTNYDGSYKMKNGDIVKVEAL